MPVPSQRGGVRRAGWYCLDRAPRRSAWAACSRCRRDCTPETIQALYVYGIGEEHPADLFVRTLTPAPWASFVSRAATNTSARRSRRRPCEDADTWRARSASAAGRRRALRRHCSGALGGRSDELPFRARRIGRRRGEAAAWCRRSGRRCSGHYFRDFWNCGEDADRLGLWALDGSLPRGRCCRFGSPRNLTAFFP